MLLGGLAPSRIDERNRSALLNLACLAAAGALAFSFLYFRFSNLTTDVDEFPEGTGGYFATFEDHAIHCRSAEDAHKCLEGLSARGAKNAALWLGNSQLHAVNQHKAGQRHAPDLLSERLRERGVDLLTFSQPNGNVLEHLVLFTYLRQQMPLRVLLLPLVFNAFREGGVRTSVTPAFADGPTAAVLEEYEIGRRLLADHRDAASQDFAALEQTVQERSEAALTSWLSEHSTLWQLRRDARSALYHLTMDLRNIAFGITPQSKRHLIPGLYRRNMAAATAIMDQAREAGIRVVAYICPVRSDIEIPYVDDEYARFKREVEELASRHGAIFVNLEDLVPGSEWGAKGGIAGQLELDFSHFRAQGHVLLAGALGDLLEDEELVASP
jgi:lysophospholipase L1-like esterase